MGNLLSVKGILLVIFMTTLFVACSEKTNSILSEPITPNTIPNGSGSFEYISTNNKTVKVFSYIPSNTTSNTAIVFVFHGVGRNAEDYRNALISKADQYGFIIMTPEFSNIDFPKGDAYNLGNVFVDGDNPSPSTLNPEEEWSFSVIEPLFDSIKKGINNSTLKYHIIGHSAGGQFAHRFTMYKPNARSNKIVASASGWYTVTDLAVSFPYGFMNSPLETRELSSLFEKKLILQVGSLDNDPSAASLRHNEFADAQGPHRVARANYFFNTASQLAKNKNITFQWKLYIKQNADHNSIIALQNAADLIFN
jgi:hypothetical protein